MERFVGYAFAYTRFTSSVMSQYRSSCAGVSRPHSSSATMPSSSKAKSVENTVNGVIELAPRGQKYFIVGQKLGQVSEVAAPLDRAENATSPSPSRSRSMSWKLRIKGCVVNVNIRIFTHSLATKSHKSFTLSTSLMRRSRKWSNRSGRSSCEITAQISPAESGGNSLEVPCPRLQLASWMDRSLVEPHLKDIGVLPWSALNARKRCFRLYASVKSGRVVSESTQSSSNWPRFSHRNKASVVTSGCMFFRSFLLMSRFILKWRNCANGRTSITRFVKQRLVTFPRICSGIHLSNCSFVTRFGASRKCATRLCS
mmetsp:Transcript_24891/g.62606  ORF Transcript_24891/g.62606 Transcript_24891/m.62606 type:complete len:313 (-) Transcript_24891:1387-2325(-)